jgi:hypothetical protein
VPGPLRHLPVLVALAVCALAAGVGPAGAEDGRSEARVSGVCGAGGDWSLRVVAEDGAIELEFEVDDVRRGAAWRVALVRERRVVWKGSVTTRRSGSFRVRRVFGDLPGAETVTARAWGPAGKTCRGTVRLPGP